MQILIRRPSLLALGICLAVAALSFAAMAEEDEDNTTADLPAILQITTNLLSAEPGSWMRHSGLGGASFTNYVVAVDEESVTLQQIYRHHHRTRANRVFVLSRAAIREAPIDEKAADARPVELSHEGKTYQTRAVRRFVNNAYATFYITDSIPVTGILRVDLEPANGHSPLVFWTDSYGFTPDDLILELPAPETAQWTW